MHRGKFLPMVGGKQVGVDGGREDGEDGNSKEKKDLIEKKVVKQRCPKRSESGVAELLENGGNTCPEEQNYYTRKNYSRSESLKKIRKLSLGEAWQPVRPL